MGRRFSRWIRWGAAVAGVATLLTAAAQPPHIEVYPERGPCVADRETMRREHHQMLKHQRFISVHEGVRDAKVDFNQCIACHASPQSQSVAARPEDFCVACHRYAAVAIDCFSCHQPTVSTAQRQGGGR
jgi:6-phosphofructokinase